MTQAETPNQPKRKSKAGGDVLLNKIRRWLILNFIFLLVIFVTAAVGIGFYIGLEVWEMHTINEKCEDENSRLRRDSGELSYSLTREGREWDCDYIVATRGD